ncbi:MAG: 4Fe-4S binding protein [Spirochaetales bacterium]|nr:4Fe-4S binding protein [Spirochaetales bacterium]
MADKNKRPIVNIKECMACRICVSTCPFSCLQESRTGLDRYNKAYPELLSPDTCTACGLCARACPVDAITMNVPAGPSVA